MKIKSDTYGHALLRKRTSADAVALFYNEADNTISYVCIRIGDSSFEDIRNDGEDLSFFRYLIEL